MTLSLSTSEQDSWKSKVNRLRKDLEAAKFKHTLNVNDFDSFHGALGHLYTRYSHQPLAKLVNERLAPLFDHVRSFDKAITLSVQQTSIASYVWSASLAIIECTCRHADQMRETFDQLANFYRNFPMFDAYIGLFPNNTRLRFILQDLYEIYSDFCIHTIKYMGKGTLTHTALNLFSSGARRSMSSILKRWDSSEAEFEEHTRLAFRTQMIGLDSSTKPADTPTTIKTSNMPRLQFYFTGRDGFLKELHNILTEEDWQAGSEPKSCLIHAMGGMGKTQAALAYSYWYEKDYDYRFWVRSEESDRLTESFNSIAALLSIQPGSTHTLDAVKQWLETTDNSWLLIFDNVEEETIDALEILRPTRSTKHSAIILTSQLEQHKHRVQSSIPLRSLSLDESVELLIKCLRRDPAKVTEEDQKVLQEVSDMIGGLPLAIIHIGGYISESKHRLSYFRDFFKSRWQRYAWGGKSVVEQYHKRLEIVWDLALDELPANARQLINIMAYLNPDEIPEEWLAEDIAKDPDWGFPSNRSMAGLLDMTRALSKRCLVDLEEGEEHNVFSIHRTLQVALRLELDKDPVKRREIFNHALSIVSRSSPRASRPQIPHPIHCSEFQGCNPHCFTLCQAYLDSDPPLDPSFELADVLYNAGFHIWERGNPITRDGTLMLETSEKILDKIQFDPNGRLRADISCVKALLLDLMGLSKREESLELRRGIVQIRENILRQSKLGGSFNSDIEHLHCHALNDLGLSYLQMDNFLKAEELFDQCMSKYSELGTETIIPYEYARYYHNIGLVRMYQGRYDEAISMSEKSISIKERIESKESSRYWGFQYNIACIMLQAGQLDRALERHLEVLANRQRVCGATQEVTLQSLYTVGAMYQHLQQLPAAEKYFKDCIKGAKKVRWHDGALGRTKYHLAVVLQEQGKDVEEATRLHEEARQVLNDIYDGYGTHPSYLQGATDEVLFDWTQPSFDGRWTGRDLLRVVQQHFGVANG